MTCWVLFWDGISGSLQGTGSWQYVYFIELLGFERVTSSHTTYVMMSGPLYILETHLSVGLRRKTCKKLQGVKMQTRNNSLLFATWFLSFVVKCRPNDLDRSQTPLDQQMFWSSSCEVHLTGLVRHFPGQLPGWVFVGSPHDRKLDLYLVFDSFWLFSCGEVSFIFTLEKCD